MLFLGFFLFSVSRLTISVIFRFCRLSQRRETVGITPVKRLHENIYFPLEKRKEKKMKSVKSKRFSLAKKGVTRREMICELLDFRGDALSSAIFKSFMR